MVLVRDNYLDRHPNTAKNKSNGVMQERADFLVFDFDRDMHKHYGSEADNDFNLESYHPWK